MQDELITREEFDLLVGQLGADALLHDTLLIALMELHPSLHPRIEAKVAVMAPAVRMNLSLAVQRSFDSRLAERLQLLRDA